MWWKYLNYQLIKWKIIVILHKTKSRAFIEVSGQSVDQNILKKDFWKYKSFLEALFTHCCCQLSQEMFQSSISERFRKSCLDNPLSLISPKLSNILLSVYDYIMNKYYASDITNKKLKKNNSRRWRMLKKVVLNPLQKICLKWIQTTRNELC